MEIDGDLASEDDLEFGAVPHTFPTGRVKAPPRCPATGAFGTGGVPPPVKAPPTGREPRGHDTVVSAAVGAFVSGHTPTRKCCWCGEPTDERPPESIGCCEHCGRPACCYECREQHEERCGVGQLADGSRGKNLTQEIKEFRSEVHEVLGRAIGLRDEAQEALDRCAAWRALPYGHEHSPPATAAEREFLDNLAESELNDLFQDAPSTPRQDALQEEGAADAEDGPRGRGVGGLDRPEARGGRSLGGE